jgi:hypothetical protein
MKSPIHWEENGISYSRVMVRGEDQLFARGKYEGQDVYWRVHRHVDGVPIRYDERRRYSNATFTWVSALIDGEWQSLGDPWQCINPPLAELRREIAIRRKAAAAT